MNHPSSQQLIALSLIDGVGPVIARQLLDHFETPEHLFLESDKALRTLKRVGEAIVVARQKGVVFKRAEEELTFAEQHQVEVIPFNSPGFPHLLSQCNDAPLVLFKKGNGLLKEKRTISVVGTRKASPAGKAFCEELVNNLAINDIAIHSGLAYGVDITAHKAALKNGIPTYCTLAHGLDRIYPARHKSVAHQMLEYGGWITEFLSGTKPDRENFPKRNRIVAGISQATIVIESARKGGSLITANLANAYNRDVFAVPGRVNDEQAAGCNFLIKTNRAHLMESVNDLLYLMNWDQPAKEVPIQQKMFAGLSNEDQKVVDLLKDGKKNIDDLMNSLNVSMSELSSQLLMMEFDGVVRQLPGKVYELV